MIKLIGNSQIKNLVLPILGVTILMFGGVSRTSHSQEYSNPEYQDLVLAVFTDNERVSAGIFAIEFQGNYYLPVAELASAYGITTTVQGNRAQGVIYNQGREFLVDAEQNLISLNGSTIEVPKESFLSGLDNEGDIYMNISLFEKIWPVDLTVNKSALALKTEVFEDLPFQLSKKREELRNALTLKGTNLSIQEDTYRPFLANPYQLYSKPTLSIGGQLGYFENFGEPRGSLNVGGTQDLLYAQADYTATVNQQGSDIEGPDAIRLRFKRQNIHENALPVGLEEVQWGDVNLGNRDLIGSGVSGRGAIFTTRKNNFEKEFDRITIDGIATPGWETELYLNNQLLAFGEVQSDGVYRFEDVSVAFGRNKIKVVLYGPQGQIVERNEEYVFRSNLVKAGEQFFSGGIVDQNERLIELEEREGFFPDGIAANIYGARGITDRLTVFASGNILHENYNLNSVQNEFLTAGAIASFDNNVAQVEAYKQLDGGVALDTRLAGGFKGFNYNAQASVFNDFENQEERRGQNARKFEFDFSLRKTIATLVGGLSLQGQVNYQEQESGNNTTRYTTRQSFGVGRTRFSNNTSTNLSNGEHILTRGNLAASRNFGRLNLRSNLNYNVDPESELTSVDLSMRYRLPRDYSTSLNVQRNLISDTTSASLLVSKDFDRFIGSVGANWSDDNGVSLLLRANTTLSPLGEDGSYVASGRSLRGASPVSAFTYKDLDYDGFYSEGDEPIEGSRIVIDNRLNRNETLDNGFMVDINSNKNRRLAVSAYPESIDDPYLVPANPGYEIYPRAGVVQTVALPLIETGAIDGSVRFTTGKSIAGLELELMDAEGKILNNSITAPDGYFTFEQIPPGQYTIRAAPETGVSIPFKYVDLAPGDLFKFGEDIDVVDISGDNNTGIDLGFDNQGQMSLKNIVTLAKGLGPKEKRVQEKVVMQKAAFNPFNEIKPFEKVKSLDQPVVSPKPLFAPAIIQEPVAPVKKKKSTLRDRILNLNPNVDQSASLDFSNISPAAGEVAKPIKTIPTALSSVTDVRIGRHSNKERVVLDLSEKTKYTLNHDSAKNAVYIDMPEAAWSASKNWSATSTQNIVTNYSIEEADQGVRMVLAVADGAEIGQSGMLNADQGKKDRLYIDITR